VLYCFLQRKCASFRHTVGNEIYRSKDVCVYEVDGSVESTYCRGLMLLMALFSNDSAATSVDSSACDVVAQASIFYVLMKNARDKYHIMGFFSKVIFLVYWLL
jgi:hypothetical protein